MVNAMRYIRLGVCICILLFVHNQILMADEAVNTDSITTEYIRSIYIEKPKCGAPDKPCGVGRADANPKLLLNDT